MRREFNQEADLLTKRVIMQPTPEGHLPEHAALADLHHMFELRFQQPMRLVWVPPPEQARASITPVLRRHEQSARRLQKLLRKAMHKRRPVVIITLFASCGVRFHLATSNQVMPTGSERWSALQLHVAQAQAAATRNEQRRQRKHATSTKLTKKSTKTAKIKQKTTAIIYSAQDQARRTTIARQMADLLMQGEAVRDYRLQTMPNSLSAGQAPTQIQDSSELLDIEKELQLYNQFAAPKIADRANTTAREALNKRQNTVMDSLQRSQKGLISLNVNPQRKQGTAQLAQIHTREQYQQATSGWVDTLLQDALTIEYQGNRVSMINHWRVHCNEGWGKSMIRVERLSTDIWVRWFEEDLAK